MKVMANNDIYGDGRLLFLEDRIYTVFIELQEEYALYAPCGEIWCFPKECFSVLPEEGVK